MPIGPTFDEMIQAGQASKNALREAQINLANEQAIDLGAQRAIERQKMADAQALENRKLDQAQSQYESSQKYDYTKLGLENTASPDAADSALGGIYSRAGLGTYSATPERSNVTYSNERYTTQDAYNAQAGYDSKIGMAMGGVVGRPPQTTMQFANGGEVAAGYPAYVKAAGANAMSPQQYAKVAGGILAKRAAQQQQARVAGQTQLYAKGGEVTDMTAGPLGMMGAMGGMQDVGGAMLDGPGTGKSDSIPAMIDGQQPAALSKGEFVVPRHVVEYFGTKHFDQLVEKARMAGKKKAKKGAM